jgi:hypothetical protein
MVNKNLQEMTSKELKEAAKNLHISNWWKMKKEDLIAAISSMTEEEKAEGQREEENEKKLFEHYEKNWSKYGPKNDWVKFLEKYKKGKIDLIIDKEDDLNDLTENEQKQHIIEETNKISEEEIEVEENDVAAEKETKEQSSKIIPKRGAKLEYNGKSQNICKWGEELGISANTLYGRIYKMGWSIEKAFTTPAKKGKK